MEKNTLVYFDNILYERNKEVIEINNAYKRACNGNYELLTVEGNSGTGKTHLITKTIKSYNNLNGFFVYGKFEQFNDEEPYIAFIHAFKNLILQILTTPKDEVDVWCRKLKKVLGRNGTVIAKLIPELELLIGKQHQVTELDPYRAKSRFENVFKKFIQTFANPKNPMVLFLDDIQWADSESLQLLKSICENRNNKNLLIITSFRNEKIEINNYKKKIIKEIENKGINLTKISLNNFTYEQTIDMICSLFNNDEDKTKKLGAVLYKKTLGNPLCINQILHLIYNEKYLYYDRQESCYNWKIDKIVNIDTPSDIVHIIIKNIKKLPQKTLSLLKIAACIGNTFNVQLLSLVCKKSLSSTYKVLEPAISSGLVVSEKDEYSFKFIHDKIQEETYNLLTDKIKKVLHLKVGNSLIKSLENEDLDNQILSIMSQFNHSLDIIENKSTRIKLANYNLIAGDKAKTSTAWRSAIKYYKAGISLLPQNTWQSNYGLSYKLNIGLSQCLYVVNNYDEAEALFDYVHKNIKDKNDIAKVYYLKTILYTNTGNLEKSIISGINGLKCLGINISSKPSRLTISKEIFTSRWFFRNSNIKKLINKPESNNTNLELIQEILIALQGATSNINKNLFKLLILKLANISFKNDSTKYSHFAYIGYSIHLKNPKKSYEIKKIVMKLNKNYYNESSTHLTYFYAGAIISYWNIHINKSIEYLEKAHQLSVDTGDNLYAIYSILAIFDIKHIAGYNLNDIYDYLSGNSQLVKTMPHGSKIISMYKQIIETYSSKQIYHETIGSLKNWLEIGNNHEKRTGLLLLIELMYFNGEYKDVIKIASKYQNYMESNSRHMYYADFILYFSLSIISVFPSFTKKEQRYFKYILKNNLKQFDKWSKNCQENFKHKYLLMSGGLEEINNNTDKAILCYFEAINTSYEYGFAKIEAIANELIARQYLKLKRNKIALNYFNYASKKYMLWGANIKANSLKIQYKSKFDYKAEEKMEILKEENNLKNSYEFDLIIDSYNSIKNEKDEVKKLKLFLNTALNITGAEKGCILVVKDDKLHIEFLKTFCKDSIVSFNNFLMENSNMIPKKVVRYSTRTNEIVNFNKFNQSHIFSEDEYLRIMHPYSVASIPIKSQNKFLGILYLENIELKKEIFKKDIEILEIISNSFVRNDNHTIIQNNKLKTNSNLNLFNPLSKRELEVLKLLGEGFTNKQIASSLELTINTVKTHVKNIYTKLGIDKRVQAVEFAKNLDDIS